MSHSFYPFLVLFLSFTLMNSAVHAQQTVILVRHADRDPNVPDGLTPDGRFRASALATTLKNAGVTLVVRSDTIRTKETAQPLIQAGSLTVKVVKADDNHVKNVFEAIRAAGANSTVLYVGHSNTIGPLLTKLGHKGEVTINEQEYGNLFVFVPNEVKPVLIKLHYGK